MYKRQGAAIGAAIGTAVGAGTGALIGKKMDKAAAEAKQIEGAQVEQITAVSYTHLDVYKRQELRRALPFA